jgi:hypothetical protein
MPLSQPKPFALQIPPLENGDRPTQTESEPHQTFVQTLAGQI